MRKVIGNFGEVGVVMDDTITKDHSEVVMYKDKELIMKAKETFDPLYKKGDKFKIIKINENPQMIPIEAMRLKDKRIYGFEEEELI